MMSYSHFITSAISSTKSKEVPCNPNSPVVACVGLPEPVVTFAALDFQKNVNGNVIVAPAAVLLSKKTVLPNFTTEK